MKSEWMSFEELPPEVQPLAMAYNQTISQLYSTSNVVRFFEGGDYPKLHIQIYGRLSGVRLRHLEILAGCLVELEAIAPKVTLIMMSGGFPKGEFRRLTDDKPTNFLYREMD